MFSQPKVDVENIQILLSKLEEKQETWKSIKDKSPLQENVTENNKLSTLEDQIKNDIQELFSEISELEETLDIISLSERNSEKEDSISDKFLQQKNFLKNTRERIKDIEFEINNPLSLEELKQIDEAQQVAGQVNVAGVIDRKNSVEKQNKMIDPLMIDQVNVENSLKNLQELLDRWKILKHSYMANSKSVEDEIIVTEGMIKNRAKAISENICELEETLNILFANDDNTTFSDVEIAKRKAFIQQAREKVMDAEFEINNPLSLDEIEDLHNDFSPDDSLEVEVIRPYAIDIDDDDEDDDVYNRPSVMSTLLEHGNQNDMSTVTWTKTKQPLQSFVEVDMDTVGNMTYSKKMQLRVIRVMYKYKIFYAVLALIIISILIFLITMLISMNTRKTKFSSLTTLPPATTTECNNILFPC